MSGWRILRGEEIAPGTVRAFEVDGERVLLCRTTAGALHAVADRCSHDGGALGEGTLNGTTIECPRHGARFDVTTGAAVRMPAVAPIERHEVRVDGDGWIVVELEDA